MVGAALGLGSTEWLARRNRANARAEAIRGTAGQVRAAGTEITASWLSVSPGGAPSLAEFSVQRDTLLAQLAMAAASKPAWRMVGELASALRSGEWEATTMAPWPLQQTERQKKKHSLDSWLYAVEADVANLAEAVERPVRRRSAIKTAHATTPTLMPL